MNSRGNPWQTPTPTAARPLSPEGIADAVLKIIVDDSVARDYGDCLVMANEPGGGLTDGHR